MARNQTPRSTVLEALGDCLASALEQAHDLAVTPLPSTHRLAVAHARRLRQAGEDSAILAQAIEVFSRRA